MSYSNFFSDYFIVVYSMKLKIYVLLSPEIK